MLPICLDKKNIINACRFLILLTILFAVPVFAQTASNVAPLKPAGSISAETILINIGQQVPNLFRMVTAFAYVMGMYFVIHGIIKLKHFGESRTLMSEEHSLNGPLILIAVGAMLLYLPSSVQAGLSTFWTNPNPYGYQDIQSDQWSSFLNDCFIIIQLVGVIAFIRGLLLISHLGQRGGQQGTLSRGLTHIIGGLFCINIYQFVQVILVTLGIGTY